MNVAIILAGGVGKRVGYNIPKQFIRVKGKPILAYTLENFEKNSMIDAIEIVSHEDWKDECKQIVRDYNISKFRWITTGGKDFQDSVINGIKNLKKDLNKQDIVVISFGVSPLTSQEVINDSINVCKKYGNGISSEDVTLLTCFKENELCSSQSVVRENLKAFSNPWSFIYGDICEVYEEAKEKGILDKIEPHTTSVYFELGRKIYFSKGESKNIKITTKDDLDLFEGYLLLQERRKKNDNL